VRLADNVSVSFDLAVLAVKPSADVSAAARQMFERCGAADHVEGELDERVVLFYEQLRAELPDNGPATEGPECPWMSMPLDVGNDHVIMHLRFGPVAAAAIERILELAAHHGLAVYDPQSDDVYLAKAHP
jgi:hypothetical protein